MLEALSQSWRGKIQVMHVRRLSATPECMPTLTYPPAIAAVDECVRFP